MNNLIFIWFVFLLFIVGCSTETVKIVTSGRDVNVKVEIADNPDEWGRGLMFRNKLGENEGMLFVYPDFNIRNFWMKNTLISLDIIFIDENFEIIKIKEADPCKKDPCEVYSSEKPARYVLEVNQGVSRKNNIQEGNKIRLK